MKKELTPGNKSPKIVVLPPPRTFSWPIASQNFLRSHGLGILFPLQIKILIVVVLGILTIYHWVCNLRSLEMLQYQQQTIRQLRQKRRNDSCCKE